MKNYLSYPKNSRKLIFIGIVIAIPDWQAMITAITLTAIIIFTIIGNILVILSVFTYKPLRIVQNFFIVSLAVADLTVALLVLPLNVTYSILGRWEFGIIICKLWLTCDVMCCTASILNLCAIALDRYWAITDPINYAQKRTLRRVLLQIFGVWFLSFIISSPPLIGWNDWPDNFTSDTPCQLTSRQGYVIYSSLGSFYIPLLIMAIVYFEIYIATRRRLRERAQASKINAMLARRTTNNHREPQDRESISSDNNINIHDNKKKHKRLRKQKLSLQIGINESIIDNANQSTSRQSLQMNCVLNVNDNNQSSSGTVYQFIEEKQRISLSKERRAARTLGIIMGVFVICWLPFFLMYVILPFCSKCCPSHGLINLITWLGYINSSLNPIIYTIFNLDFRKAFRRLLGLNN